MIRVVVSLLLVLRLLAARIVVCEVGARLGDFLMDVVDVLCVGTTLASTAESVRRGLLSAGEIRSNVAAISVG